MKQIKEDWLQYINQIGINWVYVEQRIVSEELVRLAHSFGLKVMAYTVNDLSTIKAWKNELPDGIITDRVEIMDYFSF